MDLLELVLDKVGASFVGAILIEWGLSLWQNRKFSKKLWLAIALIALGAQMILPLKKL